MDFKLNLPSPVVVFDTETGGLNGDYEVKWTKANAKVNQLIEGSVTKVPAPILEIGAVILSPTSLDILEEFHTLCGPEEGQSFEEFISYCAPEALKVNGFVDRLDELRNAPPMSVAVKNFLNFMPKRHIVGGQNLRFDIHMIDAACARLGINFSFKDSPLELVTLAKIYFSLPDTPMVANYKLTTIASALGIPTEGAHSALVDVKMTVECLRIIINRFGSI